MTGQTLFSKTEGNHRHRSSHRAHNDRGQPNGDTSRVIEKWLGNGIERHCHRRTFRG